MKLFERDYRVLTAEEKATLEKVDRLQTRVYGDMVARTGSIRDFSKPARHYISLFPNNYLDIVELQEEELLRERFGAFKALVDAKPTEREVIRFIKDTQSYFIVGSILDDYRFGHHDAFLFPEFPLGNSYGVDYLLVGNGSGGWEFVFVELESPCLGCVLTNGELGEPFRRGLKQIEDWRAWLEANFLSLREVFERATGGNATLPKEFINLDMTRLHFVVIAGRRADYKPKTYRLQRLQPQNTSILHYDNLLEYAEGIIGCSTY
jgi:hypothetical protein